MPPLKSLVAFAAAARHNSFAQAAATLNVTPSAVSHQIQSLESFLRIKLFHRKAGQVSLTGAGKTYSRGIASALEIIAKATDDLLPVNIDNTLTVQCPSSLCGKWLWPRMMRFLDDHPSISISLSATAGSNELDNDLVDIAICYGKPDAPAFRSEQLFSERLLPMCSTTFKQQHTISEPHDLLRVPLIHSKNLFRWEDWFRLMGVEGFTPKKGLWIDRSQIAIDAAVDGRGVVLESELLTQTERSRSLLIELFPGESATPELESYYLLSKTSDSNPNTLAFLEWIRAEALRPVA